MKQEKTIKAYVIERVNRYGSVYRSELCPNKWSTNFENADIYTDKQTCKNEASYLVGESIKKNQKYPDTFPVIDNIRVREIEIKFLN